MENIIKFSHNYPKLHGQTSGTLVAMKFLNITDSDEFKKLLDYDTVYYNDKGEEERYPIEYDTKYMQLVFVGNYHIPFCTLRLTKNPDRVAYYSSRIGCNFNFEFLVDK